MTIFPDARTPSSDLRTLAGSTPPGASLPVHPFGIAHARAVVAEMPDAWQHAGPIALDVVTGLAARRAAAAHPDAKVIFLAELVAALAPVTLRISARLAERQDVADAKSPVRPEMPQPENRVKVSNASTEGWYTATYSYPTTPDEDYAAAMKAWDAKVAEQKRIRVAIEARHRIPQWEALNRRTYQRLVRRAWRLTFMRPQTQHGLKAKATAAMAVSEKGISEAWVSELKASVGRDAIRIIEAEADARYRADQAHDGELLALGRAWEECAARHEQTIVLRDEAEGRMPEREWPAALCLKDDDPAVLGPYSVQHAPTDQRRFAFPAVDRLRRTWPYDFCRPRRDEILAAYDAWTEQRETDEERSGLPAARGALDRARAENTALRRRILAIPANTVAGAMVKVTVACWSMGDVAGMEVDLEGYIRTGEAGDEAFACGALLDVARVLGRHRSAVDEDLRSTMLPAASAA